MRLLSSARFEGDFQDDQLENQGRIVRQGGRNVAEALCEMLHGAGYDTSEPELDGEHGWEFYAQRGSKKYWLLLSGTNADYLLQSRDVSSLISGLLPTDIAAYADLLRLLNTVLREHPRIRNVRWLPTAWYTRGIVGAESPIKKG